jgi:GNS1/SUR4 family
MESHFLFVFSILAAYIGLITWGPKLMHKFQKFELKKLMIVYNIIQVLANGIYFVLVRISI